MAGNIYLIQDEDQLVQMTESEYDSESLLQELLAKYPDLLAGDQVDTLEPRRWLLVSREVGVPVEEEGAGRWSVDHLFLDQDGIPTLVEVKRSSDTRLRREVVGQMLDYAANAIVYWPANEIRRHFEMRCERENESPDELLAAFIDDDAGQRQYWDKVATNLRAGKIRMVFVADVIPDELRRIVEFLNEQMNPAQVLAVEIKQYVGKGLKTLVPRVYGQTMDAEQAKAIGVRETKKWDERSFLQELESRGELASISISKQILGWTKAQGMRIWWGEGSKDGSFYPLLDHEGVLYYTIGVRTGYKKGYIQVPFRDMRRRKPFDAQTKREELVERLNKIRGVNIAPKDIGKYPSIPMAVLIDEAAIKQFLDALEWTVQQIRKA